MRASLPTVASSETTRQVNTRPANDMAPAPSIQAARAPRGTITAPQHIPKVGGISMTPTHNYATGLQGVHVSHKA
jgi:hypothetical protein